MMRFFRLTFFATALFLLQLEGIAQHTLDEDSLWNVYKTSKIDSEKVNSIHIIAWQMVFTNPDSAIIVAKIELGLAEKSGNLRAQANANNTMGVASSNKDDLKNALIYHQRALEIRTKLKDKKGQAVTLNNIGIVYNYEGDLATSIDYFQRSLKIKEEIGDMPGVAAAYSNIGQIYMTQKLYDQALDYYLAGLHIRDSLQDKRGMEDSYFKLAGYYGTLDSFPQCIAWSQKSVAICIAENHKKALANNYENIGLSYQEMELLDSADKYYQLSVEIREKMNDVEGLADSYYGLGMDQLYRKNYKEAVQICTDALAYAKESGYPESEQSACECLTRAYEGTRDYYHAFVFLSRSNELKDSLNTLEKSKSISRKILQYEFEKRAYTDSLRIANENAVKDLKQQDEIHRQKIYTVAGIIAFVLMVLIVVMLLRGYRQKQKSNEALEVKNTIITGQKIEVENQKVLLEEKNKAVLDSINYARSLQLAILPSERSWSAVFPDSFIFYKPKDIVAGDFYWVEASGDLVLFAVADCTGHGVPGALVSVVCSNALNRAVKEFSLTNPGEILDKVSGLVMETFAKSEKEVSDGMDISLCALNRKTNTLQWAGANNPLWIATRGAAEMTELKPDKQPVGYFAERKPFTTHTLALEKDAILYLFTDGYADQFGGPAGKKFKYKQLKDLLITNKELSVPEQHRLLAETFTQWKGELEQVDDVCVIGICI